MPKTELELQYEQAKRDLEILEQAHAQDSNEEGVLWMAAQLLSEIDYRDLLKWQRARVLSLGDKLMAEYRARIEELEAKVGEVTL